VTSNHDLIILCREGNQSVVWIDPRGRQYRHDELALLAFKGIVEWERRLRASTRPACVRVLRTRVDVVSLDRAAQVATGRMRAIAARRRRTPTATAADPRQSSLDV
jgi:hypothetical protein